MNSFSLRRLQGRINRQNLQATILRKSTAAFSLVEAVLSVGIVSFAMLGILGMVPVGLNNFQTALQLTVESSIVQSLTSELQRTDIANLSSSSVYFDEQGKPLKSEADASRVYSVTISAPQPLDAANLISKDAAKSVLLTVNNRTRPAVSNRYSVVIAPGQ